MSTFFWILTLCAYVWYAWQPLPSRYSVVAASLAFGLMAKPMAVTLPFVSLLLDFWPLGRVSYGLHPPSLAMHNQARRLTWPQLVKEKIPLSALVAASSVVTYVVQRKAGAVQSLDATTLDVRLANAVVSYGAYVAKMLLLVRLAVCSTPIRARCRHGKWWALFWAWPVDCFLRFAKPGVALTFSWDSCGIWAH